MIVLRSLLICLAVCAGLSHAAGATLPTGFTETQIGGLSNPTAMAIAPDGRIFVCQQGGQLRVIKNGALLAAPFVTLSVDQTGERGLLGVAFDPNYATNRFVYVYYTVPAVSSPPAPPHNRVSRFTANATNEDVAAGGSEFVVVDLDNLSATNHNGGAIHFGPDGKLYIAVGENAVPSNSQSLTNRHGKILRINPDSTIPSDNPTSFPNIAGSPNGANRAIWAVGLRNPFTFNFQQGTQLLHINDVGSSGAGRREEVNPGTAGGTTVGVNYGWPTCEGACGTSGMTNPIYQYTPSGECAITGGAFYNPTTPTFPAEFIGKYFFSDLCGGWMKTIDPLSPPPAGTAPSLATGISQPVDIQVANDGSLYYLARGSSSVFRVQFTGGTAPSITTHPSNQTVAQGSPATFTVTATGSATLSYQWQRNQQNISGATSSSYTLPSAAFADNGATFRCIVTNAFGNATSNAATLTVNAPPSITGHPSNQTVTQGQPATFGVTGTGSTPLSYQWQRNQTNILNATSSSYTISSASMADNGAQFRCIVTNAFGSATSNEATLTVNPPPPILLTEQGSDSAIALTSLSEMRDPFPLTDPFNLSSDRRARVMFFGINLSSAITAHAEDAALNVYPLPIEFVGNVPNFEGLTQVIVILPGNLPAGQSVFVSVTLGQASNKVRIRIQ